jgi:hypothetical protein
MLSAQGVKSLDAGKFSDGGGLWIFKNDTGGGKWVLRVHVHGRRREMGLGAYPRVSLKEARLEADKWRRVSQQGKDPIKHRQAAQRAAERNMHLLSDIAQDAFESRKAELKGDGKAGRWFSPLELHILPKLGKMPVSEIDQRDIRDTLAPIWHDKAETARKAMNRLSICIKYAAALGLDVDIQATEKAKALLGKQRHKVVHVYAGGKYLLCRHCYNLAYTSQSEPRYDRMLRRANKIRRALGGEAGTANWIAPRPKGMSQRTYQRKRSEIEWCEGQANHLFIEQFRHLLSNEDREMYFGP